MAKNRQPSGGKRQPLRTCIGCGRKRPKRELVRLVRIPSGRVEVDASGRKAGRGAYVCADGDCLRAAMKGGRLERALETAVPAEVLESLARAVAAVPEREQVPTGGRLPPDDETSPSGDGSGRNPMKG